MKSVDQPKERGAIQIDDAPTESAIVSQVLQIPVSKYSHFYEIDSSKLEPKQEKCHLNLKMLSATCLVFIAIATFPVMMIYLFIAYFTRSSNIVFFFTNALFFGYLAIFGVYLYCVFRSICWRFFLRRMSMSHIRYHFERIQQIAPVRGYKCEAYHYVGNNEKQVSYREVTYLNMDTWRDASNPQVLDRLEKYYSLLHVHFEIYQQPMNEETRRYEASLQRDLEQRNTSRDQFCTSQPFEHLTEPYIDSFYFIPCRSRWYVNRIIYLLFVVVGLAWIYQVLVENQIRHVTIKLIKVYNSAPIGVTPSIEPLPYEQEEQYIQKEQEEQKYPSPENHTN